MARREASATSEPQPTKGAKGKEAARSTIGPKRTRQGTRATADRAARARAKESVDDVAKTARDPASKRPPKDDAKRAAKKDARASKKRSAAKDTPSVDEDASSSVRTRVAATVVELVRQTAQATGRRMRSEVAGIAITASAVLLALALFSYSPADPAFTTTGGGRVQNWIGPFGAFASDALFLFFGLFAWTVPTLMGLLGVRILRRRALFAERTIVGGAVVLVGATTLLEVVVGRDPAIPFAPGGLLGVLLGRALIPVLYPLGTLLVSTIVGVIGLVIALERPVVDGVSALVRVLRSAVDEVLDRVDSWRLVRRVLAEEEARFADGLDDESRTDLARRASLPPGPEGRALALVRRGRPSLIEDGSELVIRMPGKEAPASDSLAGGFTRAALDEIRALEAIFDDEPADPARADVDADDEDEISTGSVPSRAPAPAIVDAASSPPVISVDIGLPPPPPDDDDPALVTTAKKKKAKSPDDASTEPGVHADLRIVEREDDEPEILEEAVVVPSKPEYELPPMKLLDYDAPERAPVDEQKMHAEAEKLVRKFADFGIDGRVREIRPGPVVTTYEFVPAPGIKVSRIAALSDDIAMAMEAVHVRIVAPIPGKGAVGIEIPNEKRETVYLKEIIAHEKFRAPGIEPLTMALGKDIEGKPYYADLAAMPHVLIAGTTGSGKSVSVNAMICSLLYRCSPDELKFLMIDPKMLELSLYDGIPHLLLPPITDSKKAANALQWAVGEMERRYQWMSEVGVRDLKGFNELIPLLRAGTDPMKRKCPTDAKGVAIDKLPYIVVVVDEYADLLAVAGKEVEGFVMRLAQKARAAGIHVMLATQRPSVDVITGVIKANFPVRMGFRLASNHDSKTIINRPGAEKLLGRGDMLIMPPGTSNVTRVHGAFISEKELHRVVEFLKGQAPPVYDMSIMDAPPSADGVAGDSGEQMEKDARYDDAIQVVRRSRKCSTSWLQRQLGIGYNRAARIVEMMEREGLVGPAMNAKGDREIFLPPADA